MTINTRHISSHIIRHTTRDRGRKDYRKARVNASSPMAAIMREISRLDRLMMRTDFWYWLTEPPTKVAFGSLSSRAKALWGKVLEMSDRTSTTVIGSQANRMVKEFKNTVMEANTREPSKKDSSTVLTLIKASKRKKRNSKPTEGSKMKAGINQHQERCIVASFWTDACMASEIIKRKIPISATPDSSSTAKNKDLVLFTLKLEHWLANLRTIWWTDQEDTNGWNGANKTEEFMLEISRIASSTARDRSSCRTVMFWKECGRTATALNWRQWRAIAYDLTKYNHSSRSWIYHLTATMQAPSLGKL